jgi:hypothetical protein
MLNRIKETIKKVLPFQSKTNYKTMYENEKRLRKELEENHKAFCGQMDAVMKESKERYSVYKVNDHHREF